MSIAKVLKCPRCKKVIIWSGTRINCKCGLEIVPQGHTVTSNSKVLGVVLYETYETILVGDDK